MKAITCLTIMKKHKMCHPDLKVQGIKFMRRLFEEKSWEEFLRHRMIGVYLVGKRDLSKPIIVPEINFAVGGTLNMHTGKLEE